MGYCLLIDSIILTSVNEVRDGANVSIIADNSSICSDFQQAYKEGIIEGQVSCSAGPEYKSLTAVFVGTSVLAINTSSAIGKASGIGVTATSGASSAKTTVLSTTPGHSTSQSTRLSGGKTAGIVVGIISALLLANIFSWCFCLRRRRRAQRQNSAEVQVDKAELPAVSALRHQELAGTILDRTMKPNELAGDQHVPPSELEGSNVPEISEKALP